MEGDSNQKYTISPHGSTNQGEKSLDLVTFLWSRLLARALLQWGLKWGNSSEIRTVAQTKVRVLPNRPLDDEFYLADRYRLGIYLADRYRLEFHLMDS
ncbi:hypothetical protein RRG08_015757 [Elysia crispata]|uniref:Uncharacterized protein n=1 Tax=Elysia crispata TaxID=231223 RepID=A0AAE0ZII6_9GAST|nr:hypothetical protein RRG08_015757 [Elysia crispata]